MRTLRGFEELVDSSPGRSLRRRLKNRTVVATPSKSTPNSFPMVLENVQIGFRNGSCLTWPNENDSPVVLPQRRTPLKSPPNCRFSHRVEWWDSIKDEESFFVSTGVVDTIFLWSP